MKLLNKFFLVLMLFVLCSLSSMAYICQDVTNIVNVPCTAITPIISCVNYTYEIYDVGTNLSLYNDTMLSNGDGSYYFIFNEPLGNYAFVLCDNTTGSIVVSADDGLTPTATTFVMPQSNIGLCPTSGLMLAIYCFAALFAVIMIAMGFVMKGVFWSIVSFIASIILFFVAYNFVPCYHMIGWLMCFAAFLFAMGSLWMIGKRGF